MKTLRIPILILAGLFLVWASCEKIDKPYIEGSHIVDTTHTSTADTFFTDTTPQPRIVLLEDYTGHKCGNCPSAATKAAELKTLYGDKVVVMALHVGDFAKTSGTIFSYDFRTVPGTE